MTESLQELIVATIKEIERLEVFVTHFVKVFEKKIANYTTETTGETKKSTTNTKEIGGTIATLTGRASKPYISNIPIGAPIKKLVNYVCDNNHKRKAENIISIFSEETPERIRRKLIESGIIIFQCFESQYMKISTNAGWKSAIKIIAIDAMDRIIDYMNYCKNENIEISLDDSILKGVIMGQSKGLIGTNIQTKTVLNGEIEWKISSIYNKVGLLIENENGAYSYYVKRDGPSKPEKYGYRLLFSWELSNISKVKEEYYQDNRCGEEYKYVLKTKNIKKISDILLNKINKSDSNYRSIKIYEILLKLDTKLLTSNSQENIFEEQSADNDSCSLILNLNENQNKISIWFNVPEPNIYFTGRHEELEQINKQINLDKLIVISGLSGFGKSELALKYASNYYSGNESVLWINAENYESTKEYFCNLYKTIGFNETDLIIDDVYKYFTGQNCLFIFDNVEKLSAIKLFLPSTYPVDLKIIITTQLDLLNQNFISKPIHNLKLDGLTNSDAICFIKRILKITEDDFQNDDILNLTKTLNNHPLALHQAAVYIKTKNQEMAILDKFTILDYLKEYREIFTNTQVEYYRTISSTLQLILDKLNESAENMCCFKILNIISYLNGDLISLKLLLELKIDKHLLASTLQLLEQYSIITINNDKLNIHRIIQNGIRIKFENQQEIALHNTLALLEKYITDFETTTSSKSHIISVWNYAYKYKTLISQFITNNLTDTYTTYFHIIIEGSNYEVIETILNQIEPKIIKNIINLKDQHGNTFLHYASLNPDPKILDLLIKYGL